MEWYRADLHIHTPGSKDYHDRTASYIDILRKAEAEGLDIIAITDHNTMAGYSAMTREIGDLERWESSGRLLPAERDRLAEYRRLRESVLVLPGFEFTATFGFHILAIFDPQTSVRAIEHVLLTLGVPVTSLELGDMEVGATTDVISAYRIMAEAGALVIAAHANSSAGVAMIGLGFGGQTRIAYTQDPNLHALEVTDLETKRRRTTASFFSGSKPEYPRRMHCIQGSDAHRVTGQAGNRQNLGVGERATELLLPEASFRALKELFLSDDFQRTRPFRRQAEPVDFVEEARSEGASLVQSFHEQMTRQGGRLHAVLRDVVAMANGNGGTIYIGVSANPKVEPRGIDNPEEDMAELRAEIERQITPPLEVTMTVLKSRGKDILRVEVPRGIDAPYALEGSKIYLRRETETNLAMRDELVDLIRRAVLAGQTPAATISVAAGVPAAAEPTGMAEQASRVPQPLQGAKSRRTPRVPARGSTAAGQGRGASVTPVAPPALEPGAEPEAAKPSAEPAALQDTAEEYVDRSAAPPPGGPRTGVEIVDSEERNGIMYHTMRDLRDGSEVHNVTRQSARRLWRYAIALKEKNAFQADKVKWVNDHGLWHRYLRAGKPHYDLVRKDPAGTLHIYYGVSDDGIDGKWRDVVGAEE